MKAAVCRRYGSPGVVSVADVPRPVPRDDEAGHKQGNVVITMTDHP